jgi:thiol-disulfide isomerase/thioredoxin
VLVAAAGGWLQHASQRAKVPAGAHVVETGEIVPDLALAGLDGKEHHLSDYRGRRVLLNFWATWCGPCLQEMPALVKAQANVGENGPIVVGIAMDDPQHVRAFLGSHPLNYPVLLGSLDSPSTSLRLGNVGELLPYSVLLDENGRVLASQRGALEVATLRQWLAPTAP